ncbi:MAG: DUF3048 domain-containing protein [Lachnospiraceae bacterium]|nr:DUF3048 domain-containing protein [Lachnospiraceae bacterium]
MKKRISVIAIMLAAALAFTACGKEVEDTTSASVSIVETPIDDLIPEISETSEETEASVEVVEEPEIEIPEGMYRSELTGEFISLDLQDQRPVAIMVDNESKAYPHIGLEQADVVYELMNSTANGRITRLMCLVKGWKNIEQFGSVRSTRPTNVVTAVEWNAILIHDGGPFYIDEYLSQPKMSNHLSGGFARFSNGKNWEYTEYVTSEAYTNDDQGKTYPGLVSRVQSAGFSETYTDDYEGPHFRFKDYDGEYSDHTSSFEVKEIDLPYPHNSSKLIYNEETQTYDYYCYGEAHVDPLANNKVMSFKNLIIYPVSFFQYDEHGYMMYNCIGAGDKGYFISNGRAMSIHWSKPGFTEQTKFYDLDFGGEIMLNVGKTYITMVPDDVWDEVVYK